jgi:hypothetical protein
MNTLNTAFINTLNQTFYNTLHQTLHLTFNFAKGYTLYDTLNNAFMDTLNTALMNTLNQTFYNTLHHTLHLTFNFTKGYKMFMNTLLHNRFTESVKSLSQSNNQFTESLLHNQLHDHLSGSVTTVRNCIIFIVLHLNFCLSFDFLGAVKLPFQDRRFRR